MSPDVLEGVKTLIGETNLPKTAKELDWFVNIIQDAIKRNGADWVRQNREALLRQWEYYSALL